jgi:hypothetical protein
MAITQDRILTLLEAGEAFYQDQRELVNLIRHWSDQAASGACSHRDALHELNIAATYSAQLEHSKVLLAERMLYKFTAKKNAKDRLRKERTRRAHGAQPQQYTNPFPNPDPVRGAEQQRKDWADHKVLAMPAIHVPTPVPDNYRPTIGLHTTERDRERAQRDALRDSQLYDVSTGKLKPQPSALQYTTDDGTVITVHATPGANEPVSFDEGEQDQDGV